MKYTMPALNKKEVSITFEELLQIENVDVPTRLDKYSVLNICQKSSASPTKIYNLCVQKLFRAYNLQDFTINDWRVILEYLGNLMQQLTNNSNESIDDASCKDIEQWWLDSQELLELLQIYINTVELPILSLILIFAMDIVTKTFKFINKKNFIVLCGIQQLVLSIANNLLTKIPMKDYNDLDSINKIISSMCSVGTLMASADLKTSLETWRSVGKLGEIFCNCYKNISLDTTEFAKNAEWNWNEKAILGILNEFKKCIQLYDKDHGTRNRNLLQICQFYMKILGVIINSSRSINKKFPAFNEFIAIYTFCQHSDIINEDNSNMELFIRRPLYDVFSFIYNEDDLKEIVLQHLKKDVENFKLCNLVFDYLNISNEQFCKKNVKPDTDIILKAYNILVEGPLIFIDKDKYAQIVKYFCVFTILDSENEMHIKLCEYVMKTSWIRAYTSMDILSTYYSYIFNNEKSNSILKGLQFWINMWNKVNKSNEPYQQTKKLVELLLQTIFKYIPVSKLPQFNLNEFENIEIISLKCDKYSEQSVQYLHLNLHANLMKMQERYINEESYKELINLLEICILRPHLLNESLKENLLTTFIGMLTLSAQDIYRFREFVNKCFRFFGLQQHKMQSDKLLAYLLNHEEQCCEIQGVYLIEFLLNRRPQSSKLLEKLKTLSQVTTLITKLIDCKDVGNGELDLKIFENLPQPIVESRNQNCDIQFIEKKPRLDEGDSLNIKCMLKDLNANTEKLLKYPNLLFDSEDLDLIRGVKKNLEDILTT